MVLKTRVTTIFNVLMLFLQGGFARCYELIDLETGASFAGKVVPKSLLVKQHHREKV